MKFIRDYSYCTIFLIIVIFSSDACSGNNTSSVGSHSDAYGAIPSKEMKKRQVYCQDMEKKKNAVISPKPMFLYIQTCQRLGTGATLQFSAMFSEQSRPSLCI